MSGAARTTPYATRDTCGHRGRTMDAAQLRGHWFHSHEEDSDDRVVYRDRTYEFPPSRVPRRALNLGADGVLSLGLPGPTDARARTAGRWTLEGRCLTLEAADTREQYEIESADAGRLVLRRLHDV